MQEESERGVEAVEHVRVSLVAAYDVRSDGGHLLSGSDLVNIKYICD